MDASKTGRKSPSLGELLKCVGGAASPPADGFPELNHLRRGDPDGLPAGFRPWAPPLVLSFEDLTYSVRNTEAGKTQRAITTPTDAQISGGFTTSDHPRIKTLLNGVSGTAREGEILAVLGASGSGKTTLIDALADRISRRSLRGRIALNGEPLESRLVKAISAYVMQQDLLYPMLTVEETLMYAAELRVPRSVPAARKRERVRELIELLDLGTVADLRIGDEAHRGVSGGERRRVSIGMDMIRNPILLFLDEPTTGLDSSSAYNVVRAIQSVARSGSVVVMSIHQPSARVIDLLDRLLILSRGQVVYTGKPAGLQPFFTFFGHPIPANENHAEFALDLVSDLQGTPDMQPLVEYYRQRWMPEVGGNRAEAGASLRQALSASLSRGKLISGGIAGVAAAGDGEAKGVSAFANPTWAEVGVLSRRALTNARRQPKVFVIRFLSAMVTGFFLASVFWKLEHSPVGVQERFGFFALAMSTTYYISAEALTVFHEEQHIFMRETAYNGYRRSSYVISNAIVAIPSVALLSFAFAITTFFAPGLYGGTQGFVFYLLATLAAFWAGISFVTFLSSIIPPGRMGFTVVTGVFGYYLLVSGVFITRDRMPAYWLWLHYLSLITYPYQAVLQSEFGEPDRCFTRGVQLFDISPFSRYPEATKEALLQGMGLVMGMNVTTDTCFMDGPSVLRQQGVLDLGKWECILVLLAWGMLFRVFFYLMLLISSKNRRK